MTSRHIHESGASKSLIIATIGLSVIAIIGIILAVWAMVNYNDEKTTVNTQVESATATAKKTQSDSDQAKFDAEDKLPTRQFVGPDDYGRVTFDYPKTWSVYIDQDASEGSTYTAYLNPVSVPSVSNSNTQQYALRVKIEEQGYSQVISSYNSLVQSGKLNSSSISANGNTGTRLDGLFTSAIRGSAVIFKIRDKTLTIRTDANTFDTDFNALIQTIKFNS